MYSNNNTGERLYTDRADALYDQVEKFSRFDELFESIDRPYKESVPKVIHIPRGGFMDDE